MDAVLATLTILLSDTVSGGIVSLVGNNVFGGQLPEHYNPEVNSAAEPAGDGPAIVIVVKGGSTHDEIPMQDVDVQLSIWAGVNQNFLARAIYNRCYQVLNGQNNIYLGGAGNIIGSRATIPAIDLVDSDTGWVMLTCAFNMLIADNGEIPAALGTVNPVQVAEITGVDGGYPGENFS